jgi:hypothetical protein
MSPASFLNNFEITMPKYCTSLWALFRPIGKEK